jgi:hypothetical protein
LQSPSSHKQGWQYFLYLAFGEGMCHWLIKGASISVIDFFFLLALFLKAGQAQAKLGLNCVGGSAATAVMKLLG